MAATFHQGFSDHPAGFDVEIGHYLGLRWFHVSQIQHGIESVRQSRTGPAVATCRCGDTSRGSMDSPRDRLPEVRHCRLPPRPGAVCGVRYR
jgi:hypothetical protein